MSEHNGNRSGDSMEGVREWLDGMRFINYVNSRERGMSKERAAEIFPQAESFERMYRENASARIADDVFSPSGERGTNSDREEPRSYSQRMHGDGR